MKKLINKYWPFVLIFALSFFVTWPLFKYGYFSHQDDLQIIRIFEMRKCFTDFQIPCRWVSNMGWGNGLPLFNFYGVSTYYLGATLSYLVGYIWASKALFYVSLVAGSFGIYLLGKSLWGKLAGVVSGVLYLFAPYKALDVYVRGALAESFALSVVPFLFYFGYKLIISPKKKKYGVLFAMALFIFMITHNIMVLIFLPVLVSWIVFWLAKGKWKEAGSVFLPTLLGIGLSAFFILPAFLEKSLVQTESLLRFELDFRANYLRFSQLFFDRIWGYGTSIPGPEGGMNFQVGWPHWWLVVVSVIILLFTKIKKSMKILVLLILGTFILSVFMTHNKSTLIWVNVGLLKYFQFPWRFLSLSIFTSALLGGFVVSALKGKWQIFVASLIIFFTVIFNWTYFKPKNFYPIDDAQKLSGGLWQEQIKGALLDYLPKTALEPREEALKYPMVRSGNVELTNFVSISNKWKFNAKVDDTAEIEMPVFYFPNWKVYVNKSIYPFSYNNILGRISISLMPGDYVVKGKFDDTPLRTVANMVTLASVVGLAVYIVYGKNKKQVV
jgi:hypothetical protein